MYSHQIVPPAQTVEPATPRPVKPIVLRPPTLAAAAAVAILAAAVILALTLSGTSRIHTSTHRVAAAAPPKPRAVPPVVPRGFVRVPTTHQVIAVH